MDEKEFREELKIIIETPSNESAKEEKLKILNNEFNHSIKIIDSEKSILSYHCYMFALGFYQEEIKSINRKEYFIDDKFIFFLLKNKALTPISKKMVKDNDIIIYFVNNNPSHSGKTMRDKILSKWGSDILCEHKILEVPINYGWEYKYYKFLSKEEVRKYYVKYSKSNNMGRNNGGGGN